MPDGPFKFMADLVHQKREASRLLEELRAIGQISLRLAERAKAIGQEGIAKLHDEAARLAEAEVKRLSAL